MSFPVWTLLTDILVTIAFTLGLFYLAIRVHRYRFARRPQPVAAVVAEFLTKLDLTAKSDEDAEIFRKGLNDFESQAPASTTPVACAVRLARVFDDRQAVLFGNRVDLVHVDGLAKQMHRDDRLGTIGDRFSNTLGIDAIALGIVIDEHRRSAGVLNRQRRRDERVSAGDDFIARADAHAA